ncbi:NDR1/HIN1-like protein 2 [Corylus avellana]|uniref:NDR1/HIN1-like protein 2 n=1 Tax=Corylus avellana TaxID=13451 RepID=UPI00286BD960|nr:NDR1/HIN1-like protein 2 [Corylus avellana]
MSESKYVCRFLLVIVLLLAIPAILLSIILPPYPPRFYIVDFSIPQSSLVSKEGQNGTVLFSLEIENQNAVSTVYYDDIFLTFYFGEEIVGEKTIPAFHQRAGRSRKVFDYVDANPRVWKSFLNELISNAKAKLMVGVVSRIREKGGKHHKLDLQRLLLVGKDGKISGKRRKKIKLRHTTNKWRR